MKNNKTTKEQIFDLLQQCTDESLIYYIRALLLQSFDHHAKGF